PSPAPSCSGRSRPIRRRSWSGPRRSRRTWAPGCSSTTTSAGSWGATAASATSPAGRAAVRPAAARRSTTRSRTSSSPPRSATRSDGLPVGGRRLVLGGTTPGVPADLAHGQAEADGYGGQDAVHDLEAGRVVLPRHDDDPADPDVERPDGAGD